MTGVFTNKAITAPYRGAGRPEAAYIIERTMDRIAHELSLDPAEVRRRNFISPLAFPHKTITGIVYDSGNYQLALERALEAGDYAGWRAKQRQYRATAHSRLLGIGLASFIELSGDSFTPQNTPHEAATVRIRSDGTILLQCGVAHNGQGHFTAFAQIVSTALNVPAAKVEVQMNDSDLPGYSIGTYGSRITYAMPNAQMVPAFITDFIETPSPYNPLGAKGAGESGCIAGPPAIVNAVLDALSPYGIKAIDMPLKPEKIWSLLLRTSQ